MCTALQIIEHCQDAGQDYRDGRIYLPGEDLRCLFGCAEDDLARPSTPTRLRGVLALEAGRAADLLDRGTAPLMAGLTGWARIAVAGYVAGGRAALSALARGRYDVLARRLRPRHATLPARWARTLRKDGDDGVAEGTRTSAGTPRPGGVSDDGFGGVRAVRAGGRGVPALRAGGARGGRNFSYGIRLISGAEAAGDERDLRVRAWHRRHRGRQAGVRAARPAGPVAAALLTVQEVLRRRTDVRALEGIRC